MTRGATAHAGISRAESIGLAVHRGLDRRLSRLGVWVYRRTKGGITRPWNVDALVLTTRGRQSGRERSVVLQFFRDGDAMVLVAANDGGTRHPGWYHNLAAAPDARVEVMGRAIAVHADELAAADAAAFWPRILARSPDYERYRRATDRRFPVVRLVPTGTPEGVEMAATTNAAPTDAIPPYGPCMTRLLPAMRRGFLVVNRWFAAPALRAGLGPLFVSPAGGSILLLRTTGRRSGLVREAPLGYVIADGSIYVCAGFGRRTGWLANIAAAPSVEVTLPGARLRGLAEEVTDRAEFDVVLPALIRSLGAVGRATVPDAVAPAGGTMDAWFGTLPLVRIRPTEVLPGPWDPGGRGWIGVAAVDLAFVGLLVVAVRRRPRPRGE